MSSPTGHLTNLSTAPERGAGPAETAPEAHEALISPIVQGKCVNCHVEGGASGHTPLVFVRATDADHLAKNLQRVRGLPGGGRGRRGPDPEQDPGRAGARRRRSGVGGDGGVRKL